MEKRLVAVIAAILCGFLLFCTGMSHKNFEAKLPHVEAVSVQISADGAVLLPADACFTKPDGSRCVYALDVQPGPFGQERVTVREVCVTCEEAADGLVEVRGIYDRAALYVCAADRALADGCEVIYDSDR